MEQNPYAKQSKPEKAFQLCGILFMEDKQHNLQSPLFFLPHAVTVMNSKGGSDKPVIKQIPVDSRHCPNQKRISSLVIQQQSKPAPTQITEE